MLLALTMVLSTMVIDFTAFAAAGDAAFTIVAEIADADKDYNKGETVTVKYYAEAEAVQNIGSYQFRVDAGAGLALQTLVINDALGGTSKVNVGTGKIAWSRVGEESVVIGTEKVLLATATFTATHDATATAAISATAAEITLQGYNSNGTAVAFEADTANLWNITVTFSGDAGIENDVAGTAYVKYGEAGLYTSNAYTAEYTPVVAVAKDTYRLHDASAYWKVGEEYKTAAEIAEMTFTANATAVATTVKQYTISFGEAVNGTLVGEAPEVIVVDTGKALSEVSLPQASYQANPGYTWAGWYIGEDLVNVETYVVESDITLVAKFADDEFAWLTTPNQSTITPTAGVTDDTVVHGTDIKFTVAANTGYVVSGVSYKVGEAVAQPLTAVEGVYTIPGSAITGNITVEVTTKQYFTVTFAAADGATYTTEALTAYVVAGQSKLYASLEELAAGGDSTFVLPAYTVDDGYRADTNDPVLKWTIATTNYSDAGIGTYVFNADTAIKPYVIKYWVITFKVDANGKWADGSTADVVLNIDDGAAITGYKEPIADTGAGYVFSAWSEEIAATATEDKTYTANFVAGKYTVTIPTNVAGVTPTNITGLTEGKATFNGDDVTFKLTVDDTIATLDSVQYKVNGNDPVTIDAEEGVYTIPSSEITAETTVIFNTTGMIAVTFEADNGTVTVNTVYVENGAKLTQDQLEEVNAQPNTHYELDVILDGEDETSEEALLAKTVTAPFTVTYKYKLVVYDFDDAEYTVAFEDGYDVVSYTKDLKFKVTKADTIVLGVKYQIGEAEPVAAEFDAATGIYTIAGANVTGDITLVVTSVAGTVDFIARDAYAALTNTADKKILVVTTAKVEGKGYTYKGSAMYYSSAYGAYVAWVADTDSADLVAGYLAAVEAEATEITYSGDINTANGVTAADAGIINDCLHDQRVDETTDLMLFELDVEGNKSVSTADMVNVLTTATN